MNKQEAAEKLGLKVFDCALPQQWVDESVVKLKLTASVRSGRIPANSVCDRLLGGTVWGYDDSLFGEPVALTPEAEELLGLLKEQS